MLVKQSNNDGIWLAGELDEESQFEVIFQAIQTVHQGSKKPVFVDFSEVNRGNSIGILSWIQALERWNIPVAYRRVPTWLVEQFNSVDGFFPLGSRVESFMARFYDQGSGDTYPVELTVGRDVPILADYCDWQFDSSTQKTQGEPDFLPDIYLSFLTIFYPGERA